MSDDADDASVPPLDAHLVRRLVAAQFPDWAVLPVRPVENGGWDNRTFRLGDGLTVRLPSAAGYVPQVEKEQRWLPVLAPQVPLAIPVPAGQGAPGEGYPFPWSIYHWIPGEVATSETIADFDDFADALAGFLLSLQGVPTDGGPGPGPHSAFRGGPLSFYETDVYESLRALGRRVPTEDCLRIWNDALARPYLAAPVWFHGDISVGNLLVRRGRLSAVIDFGCAGVGDPSCDLAVAWTLLPAVSRPVFRAALSVDDATWARGRGWGCGRRFSRWRTSRTAVLEPRRRSGRWINSSSTRRTKRRSEHPVGARGAS